MSSAPVSWAWTSPRGAFYIAMNVWAISRRIIEWNGVLHGYSNIRQSSLAEYIDLETFCKDVKGNLHKIAAILYRPISDHRFDTLKFKTKQSIKMVKVAMNPAFGC